jgi:SAM-dependent methyltransferase
MQPPQDLLTATQCEYAALAELHGYCWLPARPWRHVLGIGSATGAELCPVVPQAQEFTILEPASGFASTDIGGKPVRYMQPDASGLMPVAAASFDLVVCLSCLHHVLNVGTVLRDIGRVLEPGGYILFREPTHAMGDWRRPRQGLTKRERWIPLPVFRQLIRDAALTVVRETRCMFSLTSRLHVLSRRRIWTLRMLVAADALMCRLTVWPAAHHATHWVQKIRSAAMPYVLRFDAHASRPSIGG